MVAMTPDTMPAIKCKFELSHNPKNVELTMTVRAAGTESTSRTLMNPSHAADVASILEQKKDGRVVLGDGAGSILLHSHGADSTYHIVEVTGKQGKLQGLCQHGEQQLKLINDLRAMIAGIEGQSI